MNRSRLTLRFADPGPTDEGVGIDVHTMGSHTS
jgi:hypothetical protein